LADDVNIFTFDMHECVAYDYSVRITAS